MFTGEVYHNQVNLHMGKGRLKSDMSHFICPKEGGGGGDMNNKTEFLISCSLVGHAVGDVGLSVLNSSG